MPPSVEAATPAGASNLLAPRAAYVHVPFCAHRCGYCNFTVIAGRNDLAPSYLEALGLELNQLQQPRPVETIFLGGGTPTLLEPALLEQLLALIQRWFPLAPGGEFTVEANPENFDAARAQLLAAAGVNRVSLGAQSFAAEKLSQLERNHSAEDIRRSVSLAREMGAAVSLDLIFAAPGETLTLWQHDLRQAIALQPNHISTYGLTFELGTTFWGRRLRGALASADEATESAMYAESIDALTAAGFQHYEISNFAQPGFRCRHNNVYWDALEYFAAGPGAARYVGGCREVNHRSTTTWIKRLISGQSPVAESETLGIEDRAREALMLGLRRMEGVSLAEFASRWGRGVEQLFGTETLDRLLAEGLLARSADRLRLTRAGIFVSDSLWPLILRC